MLQQGLIIFLFSDNAGGKSNILADNTVRTHTWDIPKTRTDYITDVWTSKLLTDVVVKET